MIDDVNGDPVLRELANLAPLTPDGVREQRVIARCHAALGRQIAARARAEHARTAVASAIDVLFASAVVLYAGLAVGEALRLALMR